MSKHREENSSVQTHKLWQKEETWRGIDPTARSITRGSDITGKPTFHLYLLPFKDDLVESFNFDSKLFFSPSLDTQNLSL